MQEKSNITLAQVLHILKEKKEVSLNQIQLETGVSKSYLSRLTNGSRDNPSLQILEKLADFFDTDVSSLLKDIVIVNDEEDEQEGNQEIIVDILFKEELDQTCRELWQEIQIYCNKEKVTVEGIKPIIRKIHELRSLSKKIP
ncbi:helix-turn-helix transcriptional regulator [Clostridium sp. LQ25]|uniref:helix-turn-helix domain-containing protein n=1 Tax=Clostridium sp. LQ25 TaxID=2992805 RepID=UPI00224E6977|nr:helix-turn-helix transcriptional regulator [Clostridium sp. LQ25]UZT06174.1 helix-turn-helix transcriptional regulator [Clostridium sp. LQ25]